MKGLTSPEAVIMLPIAFILDSMGFIVFILGTWFGIDDYGALDIIGGIIIGGWMLMRHSLSGPQQNIGTEENSEEKEIEEKEEKRYNKSTESKTPENISLPKKKTQDNPTQKLNPVKNEVEQLSKKALKRFGLNFAIELLPFIGGIYPGWTIMVWRELKS